jgi:hypothetical protein
VSERCLICHPRIVTREGGDHTGVDAFMRCTRCRRRTVNHVECERVTDQVRRLLRKEWFSSRTQPSQETSLDKE